MKRVAAIIFCFLLICAASPVPANDVQRLGQTYLSWDTDFEVLETVRTFSHGFDQRLTLERVRKGGAMPVGMSRFQLRDQNGRIVAYTPTRITAVPFCFVRQACWIFMWKTVYPLPAIYKFNTHPDKWARNTAAPMIYSRRGGGEGFTEQFNPLWGLFGLVLLFFEHSLYVCICILLSIGLSLQVVKYHELPEFRKVWIKRFFMVLSGLMPGPFFLEPFVITAFLICAWGVVGMAYYGIAFVNTIAIVFATFALCVLRLARLKAGR